MRFRDSRRMLTDMSYQRLRIVGIVVVLAAIGCSRRAVVGSPSPQPAPVRTGPPAVPGAVAPGERLVRAMYDMYAGKWYTALTFVQKTTITPVAAGAPLVQTWYEALSLPGKLRIDVGEPSRGDGSLYRGDSSYRMAAGKVAAGRKDMNDLLILGFDVYTQPVATSARILRARGFDLDKVHDGSWQGKAVTVVGALAGDTTSKQFWVEKERMLFVRLIDSSPQGRTDVRFDQYVRAGSGWLAVEVNSLLNGKPRVKEEYSEVHTGVAFDPGLFVPQTWSTAKHWRSE